MTYDIIFMDIDNTLLDFRAGTAKGLTRLLGQLGRELTDDLLDRFLSINDDLWRQYEHGEIEKDRIFPTRFQRWLGEQGIETDWLAANEVYAQGLRESAVFMPHAPELLTALQGKVRLFAVTNGVPSTQNPRMARSGLDKVFERVFISQEMGCKKPEKRYFDLVFDAIGPVDKGRCILLGDSLTSDMQGGRNAGIATCFYGKAAADPRCDYVIGDLLEFLDIIA